MDAGFEFGIAKDSGNVVVRRCCYILLSPAPASRRRHRDLTGELARGLADLTSPALAQTMQSIYHNPPAIDLRYALEKFSVVSICQQYRQLRCAPDAVS